MGIFDWFCGKKEKKEDNEYEKLVQELRVEKLKLSKMDKKGRNKEQLHNQESKVKELQKRLNQAEAKRD